MLAFTAAQASMTRGVVIYTDGDLIVIATKSGYTVGEYYGGHYALREGDVVVGELHSYGTKDIYCPATDRQARVWIDNFWLSEERAVEWVAKKRR